MQKTLLILAISMFLLACESDSNRLEIQANAGEYSRLIREDTPNEGLSKVRLILEEVAETNSKWASSIAIGYLGESQDNLLEIMLLQHGPQDEELVLVYRLVEDGTAKDPTVLRKGIGFGEAVKLNINWDEAGVYRINTNGIVDTTVRTNIKNPSEYFSIVSGTGVVVVDE